MPRRLRTGRADRSSNHVAFPHPITIQRANAVQREPELQSFWEEERIYERLLEENTGDKYVLHDGPPYANGELHIGHALNKVRGRNGVYIEAMGTPSACLAPSSGAVLCTKCTAALRLSQLFYSKCTYNNGFPSSSKEFKRGDRIKEVVVVL